MSSTLDRPGTIIILNGTSSAGKTTLVRALQDSLTEPYLEAGIDKFLFMLPGRYLRDPLWQDVLGRGDTPGRTGDALMRGMHRALAALSLAGVNVIADHVLIDAAWAADLAATLASAPAWMIGVRCPLPVLEARERDRKDRTLGQAARQYPVVHRYARYDLEVDTSTTAPGELAARISGLVAGGGAPTALRAMAKTVRAE